MLGGGAAPFRVAFGVGEHPGFQRGGDVFVAFGIQHAVQDAGAAEPAGEEHFAVVVHADRFFGAVVAVGGVTDVFHDPGQITGGMQPGDVDQLVFHIAEGVGPFGVPGSGQHACVFGSDLPGFPRPRRQ